MYVATSILQEFLIEENISHNYYSNLFFMMRFICTGFWGVSKPKKQWALDVMRLLRDYDDPKLWHHVSTNFVYDGKMDLSCALTADALTDLDYLLRSGEARDVTSLK